MFGARHNGAWESVIVDGEKFEALRPMYAGDISQVKDNSIGIRGEHNLTGKTIEFAWPWTTSRPYCTAAQ